MKLVWNREGEKIRYVLEGGPKPINGFVEVNQFSALRKQIEKGGGEVTEKGDHDTHVEAPERPSDAFQAQTATRTAFRPRLPIREQPLAVEGGSSNVIMVAFGMTVVGVCSFLRPDIAIYLILLAILGLHLGRKNP